jgi:D-glycero-D-manno-heptose 1,7-bisphosphate phosphatase
MRPADWGSGRVIRRRTDGNWADLRSAPGERARPCLFLDRDGVLIEERHYLKDPDLVAIMPGAVATLAAASAKGWATAVVTNQSGIARGLISWEEFEAVEARVARLLGQAGVGVDAVLACPYVSGGVAPYDRDDEWRKPRPGMLREAAKLLHIDLARSVMLGDRLTDLAAADAAGLALGVHVLTGYGAQERSSVRAHAFRMELLDADSIADVPAILARL